MTPQLPFAPSLALFREIIAGKEIPYGKEWARCLIAGDLFLSVPIEGGAACLKSKHVDISSLIISDHGRWRQEHLGAWNSVYGKTPFFDHLFPKIKRAYSEHSHGNLAEFNSNLFNIALRFLDLEKVMPDIRELYKSQPNRAEQLRAEITTKVNLNYSIFDALFRLGKNSVWTII